jgi:outer membrane protein
LHALTLDEARALALQNHPGLAAAGYRAQAAEQVVTETRAALFPQVNLYGNRVGANAADTRILAGGLNNPSVFNRTAGGVAVTQLLTDFGHTTNLAASSRLEASAANKDFAATRELVLLQVDQTYFGLLQAQAVLDVARQTLDTRQLLLDRVSVLAENKLKSELDVSFARVAVEQSRLLVQQAQSELDAAAASLAAALGLKGLQRFQLADVSTPAAEGAADVAGLIDKALSERPDLASLRDQRDASLRNARAQRDARLPTIAAVGTAGAAGSRDVRLPGDYAAGGIQLSVPLFAGGLYQARQREAELRAKSVGETLRNAEDDVTRDVRIAWSELTNARERLRTSQQLVAYAGQAYDLADARYRAGSSSIVELSQAQLELTSAQIGNANARYGVLIQQSVLDYQLGALSGAPGTGPRLP